MHITIQPDLDGLAGERLQTFAQQLADERITDSEVRELVARETSSAKRSKLLNGQAHAYEASARLLADLRLLKWSVRADAYGIELESPANPRLGGRSPEEVRESKEAVRKELSSALAEQFADPLVREFIEDLENPQPTSKRQSIRTLIADGRELLARLQPGLDKSGEERLAALKTAVQPYLQLVPGEGEANVRDEFTGIPLSDVWRYFRYTWSIPQTGIPGRQMFYLIRDRAHPSHAVIGIAALSNSALVSPIRDEAIGWVPKAFCKRLHDSAQRGDRAELKSLLSYLDRLLESALAGLYKLFWQKHEYIATGRAFDGHSGCMT